MDALKRWLKRTRAYDLWVKLRLRREWRQWSARGRTPPSPHLLKQRTVLDHARAHGLTALVETGTYMGTMIAAVGRHFQRVESIELDAYLAERARRRFRGWPHVRISQGDSGSVLPGVLERLEQPALFWLDAHYSGGITSRGALETPVEAELRAILEHAQSERHVLLIDDARLFEGTHDYPTLDAVRALVGRVLPGHGVVVEDDIIRIAPARAPRG